MEASWAVLGDPKRLGRHLGLSWRRLGGVLEASWAVLGRERRPTWLQLGSQNGAKMAKKLILTSIISMMPLGIDFWTDFGEVGCQNGTKLAQK